MRLNFAVFTRQCGPFLKVNFSYREYIEPKDASVFFVDVGLNAVIQKKSAVSVDYFRYVKHFALKYPTLFILPDSWTWENHIQYAYDAIRMLKAMNVDNMVPIIVAHYFHNYVDKYRQVVEDLHEIFPVVVIGIPANVVTVSPSYHFRCINRPTVCNQYILSIINVVKSWDVKTHILGISKQTLEYMARKNITNLISVDSDKAGRYITSTIRQITRKNYCEVFRKWLGNYDQPSVDDFLLKLID